MAPVVPAAIAALAALMPRECARQAYLRVLRAVELLDAAFEEIDASSGVSAVDAHIGHAHAELVEAPGVLLRGLLDAEDADAHFLRQV